MNAIQKSKNRYPQSLRDKARNFRLRGLTHREIAKKISIAVSTVHFWTKGIQLTAEQKIAIQLRRRDPILTEEQRRKFSQNARKNLSRFWKKPYSAEELINKIRDFQKENGRIPLKREFNMYEEYKKRFGSWNNAIRLAGFEPNPVVYSKKFIAKDGHICDSFAEKIIDDWLSLNKITHERNIRYPDTKMTADFAVGNARIEFFGLAGVNEMYDKIIERKRNLCRRIGLKLIEIYPSELFTKNFKNYLGDIIQILKKENN